MNEKKRYTREEKIAYYEAKISRLEKDINFAKQRLEYLKSENYQDWNGNLAEELAALKKLLKKVGA